MIDTKVNLISINKSKDVITKDIAWDFCIKQLNTRRYIANRLKSHYGKVELKELLDFIYGTKS